jgi:superfamily II RNA helicase
MKTCHGTFENNTEELLKIFARWPFPLSDFQKFAIDAILQKKHVIITAHTGNGKTLAADFAIKHFTDMGKKIIYTTPVKALTNQKYNTFKEKYPNISFGIITGDTTMNPDAQCIFATTEILRNTLFKKKWLETKEEGEIPISLDIDINPEELGCVVYDEIHYIMDKERGPVWHESIMMLPDTVQIIGLSATIDRPWVLAEWIEHQKNREVWLCPTTQRVIPQHHYGFVTFPRSILDKMPLNKRDFFESMKEKNILLKKPGIHFQDNAYYNIKKLLKYIRENKIHIDRFFVLNELIKYLKNKKYLPAICFVYSRKQVELIASKINVNLFEEGSKIPSTIENECKQMLMRKVPNYREYINLPEFKKLMKCLQKGIAIHHAGMIQIFKEMVEHLFEKKYIKLLIATETFAVGVDMPAQSVIFTSLQKFNGQKFRWLYPHEYSQQSGRAGRRTGDDNKKENLGRVWHLFNLYDIKNAVPDLTTYRSLLEGKPQPFVSTFKIHYNLILRLMSMENFDLETFMERSLMSNDIEKEKKRIESDIVHFKNTLAMKKSRPMSMENLKRYAEIIKQLPHLSSKKRKKLIHEKKQLEESDKLFLDNFHYYEMVKNLENDVTSKEKELQNVNDYIKREIEVHITILKENGFILDNILTEKGILASNIQEMHCMAMADILNMRVFDNLDVAEIASILSIFTSVSVRKNDSIVKTEHIAAPENVKNIVQQIQDAYNKYYDIESFHQTSFANNYDIHYNMCELVYKWCTTEDEGACYKIFEEALYYNISRGEFVKALMKINNVTNELTKIAEIQSNMTLLEKMKQIPTITLKSIVTNQSLYL